MNPLRRRKMLITFFYHLSFVVIALIGVNNHIEWPVYLLLIDLITFRLIPVTRFLQISLIPDAHCFSCHTVTNLTDHWLCSCGYAPQVPRHIFHPCANCGNTFTFLNCRCGVGILV